MSQPLATRRGDLVFLAFFFVNLTFITYIVDLEQLVIANRQAFEYPLWPPRALVDLVHWWGDNFDPLQNARPPWWRATIWIDVLGFGPYYAAAIYAFWKGRNWIRVPSFLWAAVMMTNVTIILFEEMVGPHATPRPGIVWMANLPWLLLPVAVIYRMRHEKPFGEESRP